MGDGDLNFCKQVGSSGTCLNAQLTNFMASATDKPNEA